MILTCFWLKAGRNARTEHGSGTGTMASTETVEAASCGCDVEKVVVDGECEVEMQEQRVEVDTGFFRSDSQVAPWSRSPMFWCRRS